MPLYFKSKKRRVLFFTAFLIIVVASTILKRGVQNFFIVRSLTNIKYIRLQNVNQRKEILYLKSALSNVDHIIEENSKLKRC